MKFPAQETEGTCGLYAVKYCIQLLQERDVSVGELQVRTGLSPLQVKVNGVDEDRLAKVLQDMGLQARVIRLKKPFKASTFEGYLEALVPEDRGCVITAWHRVCGPHYHWVTVAGVDLVEEQVMVIDSYQIDDEHEDWEQEPEEPCKGNMSLDRFIEHCKPKWFNFDEDANILISVRNP